MFAEESGLKPGDVAVASDADPLVADGKGHGGRWWTVRVAGPALFACLADTDTGSLIVAAQSGARWGYSLLLPQLVLIPVLFFAQELTVRLGVFTQMGYAACIKQHFGPGWGWTTTILLLLECMLAIISELSGVASVCELWGLTRTLGTLLAGAVVLTVVYFCSYRQIEIIGIMLGLCEMCFVITMFLVHPSPSVIFTGMSQFHFDDPEYLQLLTSNVGAVIMPWMIYFQQSAVVARRLKSSDADHERSLTLFGSFLTQLVMTSTVITFAVQRRANLHNIQDMQSALAPVIGQLPAKMMLTLAFAGGAFCASFVVSLAASWAFCDASGSDAAYSLDLAPQDAPLFYGAFFCTIVLGMVVLMSGVNVVNLNIFIELVDGLLMFPAVGFLYLLASSDLLPENVRLVGGYKVLLGIVFCIVATLALVTGVMGVMRDLNFWTLSSQQSR